MRRKHLQTVEGVKDKVAENAPAQLAAAQQQQQSLQSAMVLGAAGTLKKLSDKFEAQTVRALIAFQEVKGYRDFGFEDFADFLDNSPYSPMSKNQFYDRKGLLESEGDLTYNLLNDLRVPVSTRKQLTAGAITLEGDMVLIGDERVPATDAAAIREKLRMMAEALEEKEAIIAEQKKRLKKGEKEYKGVLKELDQARSAAIPHNSTPYDHALMGVIGAFAALRIEAAKLPPAELTGKQDYTLQQIANQRQLLEEVFGLVAPQLTDKERAAGMKDVIDELDAEEA